MVGRHYRRLEKSVLEASDSVIAISPDFARADAREFGIDDGKIHIIENWASLDDIRPGPKDNAWSRRHGLVGRDVALYSGTLGLKHDPSLLLNLARALQERGGADLVTISEGPAADWLAREGAGLASLRVLPFQAYEEYPDVLAAADVLVAVLEPEAGEFSVPSKILSYLCSGRPIVLSAPRANLSSRTIENAGAGMVVSAELREEFVPAAINLLDEPDRRMKCGRAARAYAERQFRIESIADRFLDATAGQMAGREKSSE
jgi:colanic acid biosynthesis glycosyl transferase WcaI